ncbi:alanine--tRNA ligase [Chromatocurvus halotolerans]|uniref:Alanine--tRNA ligase n=1 Tax=Chromatocurvus halotolerans TaxID=1132028 RepID=A0A4R2KQ95_9GAMM|nr:alanine--tRNA ligase [Chromatocurvus halotolerans]TCO75893.1 alanyl-tRNA synthetase [Chromatocurvus halotolerans]
MKTGDIREAFLAFFESHGHTRVPSSSLVPVDDPTLLFTNAGMNQFKDTFLGNDPRPYLRATSSQRCVRAGGKHNDLENVGYTARHHTFFEMLGNFSFGDYFKRDAIRLAWTFLTEELGLPPERLWVTVHVSDDEAEQIWIEDIGFPAARISRLDEDNFWQMGDTGPCGPCSEVFYDHGPDVPGGPPGSPDDDLDRYIEIWNLVFMQFNRDASGEMNPLPKPSVDTGMGLERIAAVLQGVHSNYEIDLFQALINAAANTLGVTDRDASSLRVIADHIRSCAFLVVDGVLPGNEGRGYVLRRILRRAIRHGNKLGADRPFFHRLVAPLVEQMGDAYPELRRQQAAIEKALLAEEEQFAKTLDNGMAILDEALAGLDGDEIPGDLVFRLYDTYGFPTDLTNDIARERGLTLDMEGYEAAMNAQRERSKEGGSFRVDYNAALKLEGSTQFTGYDGIDGSGRVLALLRDGEPVTSLSADDSGVVVLDSTPFYAESGGQMGDTGFLAADGVRLEVTDTTKAQSHHLHHVKVLEGQVSAGDTLAACVNNSLRQRTRLNHSATHLLHAALREILGDHVAQKGSLVDSRRLRFDFSHPDAVTHEQLRAISERVNAQIRANTPVTTRLMSMDEAMAAGAMALFGEKYGEEVRVLSMGENDFSVELCGGTHVDRTGDIGLFHITAEAGVAAGVRRIEAVTGEGAIAAVDAQSEQLRSLCEAVKATPATLVDRVVGLRSEARELEKDVARLKQKLATSAGGDLTSRAVAVGDTRVLAVNVDGADAKTLRETMDQCKNKLGSGVVFLSTVSDDKVSLTCGVTADLTDRIKAGDVMREFAGRLGGKGGGRPDMAQGGGTDVAALDSVLAAIPDWVAERMGVSA